MAKVAPEEGAPEIELIYAVADDGTIGDAGTMPWHLPSDLRHFRARTTGTPVVMGRRTFESIGRALPGRRCLVVTRDARFEAPGCEVFADLDAAMRAAAEGGVSRISVIGGAQIYRQLMDRADRLVVTHVRAAPGGDVRMPPIDANAWVEVSREGVEPDPRDTAPTERAVYERRG